MKKVKLKLELQYNSPVILTFFLLSLLVLFLDQWTDGWTTMHLFCVYRSSLKDPLFYIRLFGHVLGRIDRTMLAACATETDHQICESAVHIAFDGGTHNFVGMFQELRDLSVFFKEADDWFVQPGEMVITFILAGVVDGAAVEHEPASIATRIVGYALFIGKADDLYLECMLLYVVVELGQISQFPEHCA